MDPQRLFVLAFLVVLQIYLLIVLWRIKPAFELIKIKLQEEADWLKEHLDLYHDEMKRFDATHKEAKHWIAKPWLTKADLEAVFKPVPEYYKG